MIAFNCRCGFKFEVPAELQGEPIQCPDCGILNDVPSPTDLAAIDADGAFKLEEAPVDHEAGRLEEQLRYFGGKEDVRQGVDEFLEIGIDEKSRRDEANARPFNIDPWTGEAVTPIPLNEPPKPVLPVDGAGPVRKPVIAAVPGKTRPLDYARSAAAGVITTMSPWRIPAEMFMLGNVAVLMMLLAAHVLLQLTLVITLTGMFFVGLFAIVIAFALLGHWSNVTDETGPSGRDQLPTLLRSVSMSDDVWNPFFHMFFSMFICFGPAIWWAVKSPLVVPFRLDVWLLIAAGMVFFPAIMLTMATSGSILNLAPQRVARVMRAAPGGYLGLVILATLAGVFYGGMWFLVHVSGALRGVIPGMGYVVFLSPMIFLGLFFASWYSWALGLYYRAHHHAFGWAFQQHVRTERSDTNSRLEHINRRGATANVPASADARRDRMAVQDAETRKRQAETAEALRNIDMGRTGGDLSLM